MLDCRIPFCWTLADVCCALCVRACVCEGGRERGRIDAGLSGVLPTQSLSRAIAMALYKTDADFIRLIGN